ncbi:MAG: 2-oxoglutarate ferredoxin oxidoreductase subunit alpha [Flavobacteriales bacterium]|nr:2-oxoglutarate ferredoxin oxidoreductase subunit alpha [Flavobacteriales bacterium]|tara:strand:- start:1309 stop:3144 length:1836 start_codon:yes stop_codon:yes gene_type:complete
MTKETVEKVVIFFAGDSGDGIQLTGSQFTNTAALYGNDLSTFPDFPAEIRAPQGTLAGVSGFQISFGSTEIFTPGDECDVLVVMNVAALKANVKRLKKGGTIIVNSDGFDRRNLRLAGYENDENPLLNKSLANFRVSEINVTKLTRECLLDIELGVKEKDRCKNMFVLGFVYWMYNRSLVHTIDFLTQKFKNKSDILDANIRALKAGYNFANTCEISSSRFEVKPAKMVSGKYRNIMGNQATAIGLIAASKQSGLNLFYGSYPITPASDILHELSKHKNFGVRSFQAEDEIAAISACIGATFGGALGVTATSGPGVALKGEAIGLAFMLELPLVIVNVQRGGPSTGLPTKTEQSDLLQAVYGRNGEAPVPVVSASTPSDCFESVMEACRIAIEHMTPVFFLSDGYIANGAEPWLYPNSKDLKKISVPMSNINNSDYLPYKRDEKFVREWAIPGMSGLEHRVGGLEKENLTGNVSYDSSNHEFMVKTRAKKVDEIANYIPEQQIDAGSTNAQVLVLAWGSTYGAIKTAVKELLNEGYLVAHAHLRYINPFPKNLENLIRKYDKILIPEINNGQLIKLIRDKYIVDAIPMNKIQGIPFEAREIKNQIIELHDG